MDDDRNLAVVNQVYAAFGRGDMAGILAMLDADVTWVTPGPPDLPTGGRRQGHDQVMEFFGALAAAMDILRFTPQDFFVRGDTVVVFGDEEARIKATGRTIVNRWVQRFTIRDGKIAAFEEILDTATLVGELRAARAAVS